MKITHFKIPINPLLVDMNNSCMKTTFSQTKGFHEKRGLCYMRSDLWLERRQWAATTGCSGTCDVSGRSGAARIGVWKRKGSFTDMAGGWGHPYRGPGRAGRPQRGLSRRRSQSRVRRPSVRLAPGGSSCASVTRGAGCVGRPVFCADARPTPAEMSSRRSPGAPSAAEPFPGQLVSLVALLF